MKSCVVKLRSDNMSGYILAIKIEKCDKHTELTCLKRMRKGCESGMSSCKYPVENNPLCTCNDINSCPHRYTIVKDKDTKNRYIFYSCRGCKHLINNSKKITYKLLTSLNNTRYIYGDTLKKLTKKLIKEIPKKESNIDVDFFKNLFSSINPGVRL